MRTLLLTCLCLWQIFGTYGLFSELVERALDKRCGVDVSARSSCGEAASEVECASRGCCYDPCIGDRCAPTVPKCYLSSYMVLEKECQVNEAKRRDCGFTGISMDACMIRGCCWKPSPISDVPWCFYSSSQATVLGGGTVGGASAASPPGIEWKGYENGMLPSRSEAVRVSDSRGDTYYIGRITGLGGVFPAKIHTRWGAAYFGLEGLEITSKNFEAMVKTDSNVKLSWTSASDGELPAGAIVGGHAVNDASHMYYVATASTRAGDTPGYLDPAAGCTVVSWGWGSKCYSNYKVLTWSIE